MASDLLGSEMFAALREVGSVRRYRRGDAIMHERQVPDSVVVICSGHVKLTRNAGQGKEALLAIRGPGELLGELSALDGEPRSATAAALDDVEALAVPASTFLGFLQRAEFSRSLLGTLSRRLRDADLKRVEFAGLDSIGRVSSRLVELCERFGDPAGDGFRIQMLITQDELADWAACSREATSKALHALRDLSWIETSRGSVTIHALDELRRRSL